MSTSFNLCPVLTDALYRQIGYAMEEPTLTYPENDGIFPLTLSELQERGDGFTAGIRDERCSWAPETHSLSIHWRCSFSSPRELFGRNGIAPANGTIGVGLRWSSRKAYNQGVIPLGELKRSSQKTDFDRDYVFGPGTLKGSLRLNTFLYLLSTGPDGEPPEPDEAYLANVPGYILGEMGVCELMIDGNGSLFPIVLISEPNRPLWEVFYDVSADPETDSFDNDHVEIRLNRAHRDYAGLDIESSLKRTPLLMEVLSSAMFVILESIRAENGEIWDALLSSKEELVPGSIAAALQYFSQKLEWDFSSPVNLMNSIKQYVEKS